MIEIGTEVESFALPKSGKGIVVKQFHDRKGANGEDLYGVRDENGELHIIVSSLFDRIGPAPIEPIVEKSKAIDIEKIKMEIEVKLDEVIKELKLQKSDDVMTQLQNCCLVQKYIVEHNMYNDTIMEEKENYPTEDLTTLDLYNALVLQNGVCTSNSLMFKEILKRVGIKVEVIGLLSNENGAEHAANIVELDGMYYFFDTTLESTIYHENSQYTDGKILLCCAGLGIEDYCPYYTPIVVLPSNALDPARELPENMATSRIPIEIINNLIHSSEDENKQLG